MIDRFVLIINNANGNAPVFFEHCLTTLTFIRVQLSMVTAYVPTL